MRSLILVVEDDAEIKNILLRYLNFSEIDFMFAPNLKDAVTLFKQNEKLITHIALDGRLSNDPNTEQPDTEALARIIATSNDFKGKVFVMSSEPVYNDILMYCENSQESDFSKMLEQTQNYLFTSKGELILGLKFDSGSVFLK